MLNATTTHQTSIAATIAPSTNSTVVTHQKSSPLKIKLVSSGVAMPELSPIKTVSDASKSILRTLLPITTTTASTANLNKPTTSPAIKNTNVGSLPVITSVRSGFYSSHESDTKSQMVNSQPKLSTHASQSTQPATSEVLTNCNAPQVQLKIPLIGKTSPVDKNENNEKNSSTTETETESIEIIDSSDEEDTGSESSNKTPKSVIQKDDPHVMKMSKQNTFKEVGFLYSDNVELGKIPVEKCNDSIQFRLPCLKFKCYLSNIKNWKDLSSVENFLAM